MTIPIDPAKWSTLVPAVWAMSFLMSWMIEYHTGNEAGVANEAMRGWLLKAEEGRWCYMTILKYIFCAAEFLAVLKTPLISVTPSPSLLQMKKTNIQ